MKAAAEAKRRAAEDARKKTAEEARRKAAEAARKAAPKPAAVPGTLRGPDIRRLISGRAVGIVRPTRRGGGTLRIWFSFRGDGTFERRCSVRTRFGGIRGCRKPLSFGRWWLRDNQLCLGRRRTCFTIHRLSGGYAARKTSGGRSAFAGPFTVRSAAPR